MNNQKFELITYSNNYTISGCFKLPLYAAS